MSIISLFHCILMEIMGAPYIREFLFSFKEHERSQSPVEFTTIDRVEAP